MHEVPPWKRWKANRTNCQQQKLQQQQQKDPPPTTHQAHRYIPSTSNLFHWSWHGLQNWKSGQQYRHELFLCKDAVVPDNPFNTANLSNYDKIILLEIGNRGFLRNNQYSNLFAKKNDLQPQLKICSCSKICIKQLDHWNFIQWRIWYRFCRIGYGWVERIPYPSSNFTQNNVATRFFSNCDQNPYLCSHLCQPQKSSDTFKKAAKDQPPTFSTCTTTPDCSNCNCS